MYQPLRGLTSLHTASPTRYVGGDFGNATALLADGSVVEQIPSYIGTGSLADLLASRGGAGGQGQLLPGEFVIAVDGQEYFVGNLALEQGRNITAAQADTARYTSGHTRLLLMALAAMLYPLDKAIRLRLVTGAPPALLKTLPTMKQAIAESLLGSVAYTFTDTFGSRDILLTVERVAVVMEGVAALATLGESGKPIGLIDVGGYTTDITWFDAQGKISDARTQSLPDAGVGRAGAILSNQFRAQHGRALQPDELSRVFANFLVGEETPIFQRGEHRITHAQVEAALQRVARDINTFLGQHWAIDGAVAADGAYVQLIGGGALFYRPFLQLDTELRVPAQPEQQNALSFAAFAQRIEARGSWPTWGGA